MPSHDGAVRIAVAYSHGQTAHLARTTPQLPIPAAMLTPVLPAEHVERLKLQKNFSGFGTWMP